MFSNISLPQKNRSLPTVKIYISVALSLPGVCSARNPPNGQVTKSAEGNSNSTKGLRRKMAREDQIINPKKLGSVLLLGRLERQN